ncbi:DUF3558 domain-containing protein [Lentzea rhizosphaerae]|uniref:DUF3558 domain-containing protein n=1 Tax=Lentzea rhizosphaerae TaxID=2041025 RepID=A0ABV8C2N9_9PSEU
MRIRTTVIGIAAALAVLSGCTGGGTTGTPTQTSTNTSSSSGDTTPNGAPRVKTPLAYERFEADPCSVVTAAQLEALGLPGIKGELNPSAPGKSCIWHGSKTPSKATPGIVFLQGVEGLDALYGAKANMELWEPQPPIQGFPAVLNSAADLRASGNCSLDVGITDKQVLSFLIQTDKGGTRYSEPCAAVTDFANQVITTIKAGAK